MKKNQVFELPEMEEDKKEKADELDRLKSWGERFYKQNKNEQESKNNENVDRENEKAYESDQERELKEHQRYVEEAIEFYNSVC